MLTDDRQAIRELGYRKVMAARKENRESTSIRQFRVPTLNFAAEDYPDLVERQSIDKCEPPLTKYLSDSDVLNFVKARVFDKVNFLYFLCHTQSVERCTRLVTQASAADSSEQQRDGLIKARIKSRTMMKHFNTKMEFRLT